MPENQIYPTEGAPSQPTEQVSSPERKKMLEMYAGVLQRMVDFRRPFDVRRSMFYRQYLGQRDQQMFPDGVTPRSNTTAKYPWSNVETVVSRVHDAFFGYEDWFEVRGRGMSDGDSAEKMQVVLKNLMHRSHITAAFEDLVRNIALYGHGAIKVEWDHGYDLINIKQPIPVQGPDGQPVINPQTGEPLIQGYQPTQVPVPRNKFRFIPIDIYDLLIDPDQFYVGMMADKTFGQLKQDAEGFQQANPDAEPLYYPEAISQLQAKLADVKDPDNVIVRIAEVWDKTHNSFVQMTASDKDAIQWKDRRQAYRFASYSGFRGNIYGGEPLLLYAGDNPFNHKQCPILHTGYVRLPNEAYGIGVVEPTTDDVESLSKFMNMIVDNWNLGINRRYAYDINANIDHEALNKFNTPGGKIAVDGDPNKVIAPLPFFTPEGGDYQLLELYQQLIQNTSGISDFYSRGIGGPQGNDTATGISSVISESNFKFRMFIRNLELYVMQPLLDQCANLVQQFLTDDIEQSITDEQAMIPKWQKISPQELIGNYSYELVAANYVTNKIVKQRNLMAFVNVVGASPFWNQYEGLRALAKVFEIPNIGRLLKTQEQVQQEQQAQMTQQIQMQEMLAQHEQRRANEQIILSGAVGAHQAATKAKSDSKSKGSSGNVGGRPAKAQFEGSIPGMGATSPARDIGQSMGANALGLGQMGELNNG